MYDWRKMTDEDRGFVLQWRKHSERPWHSPPHRDIEEKHFYIISEACYEHKKIIGQSDTRMLEVQEELIKIVGNSKSDLYAWCILPNHYHLLAETEHVSGLRKELGTMHGRTARQWNIQDNAVGRKVWFNCVERTIRNERHFWASVNYIHHNPVKHNYAEKWTDWKYSSAEQYLNDVGKQKALEIWKEYPILEYGDKWDI